HVDNGDVIGGGAKSSIEVKDKNGTMVVGSTAAPYSAKSVKDCKGKGTIQVFSPGQKVCPGAPTVADPNYTLPVTSQFTDAALPSCSHQNDRVISNPGKYTDANALTNMMKKNSACKGSVFWFKPGQYYFEFTNGHEWKIDQPAANVVAGAAKGGW